MIRRQKTPVSLLVLLLLTMWGILTIRIDAPWFGHHDENGRWISTAVRNYQLYGAENLRYLVTTTPYPSTVDELYYYVHHPPLIVWSVSIASDIFGRYGDEGLYIAGTPYELPARLVVIFATMISLSAFYVIVRRLFDGYLAWVALFIYSISPMTMYFGRMVNHEPLALAFLYLYIAILINWLRQYTHQRTIALICLAILAMWTAWAPAFFLITTAIVVLLYGRPQHRWAILIIGGVVLLGTSGIIFYYATAFGDTLDKLLEAFIFRTSNQSMSRNSQLFTLIEFLVRQLSHMLSTMSFGIITLGILGVWRLIRKEVSLKRAITLALLIAGLLYMIVFRNAFFIHDYYKIYLMCGMAITSAIAFRYCMQMRPYDDAMLVH